jgi:F-type H+-transporting ATPase subunit a
MGMGQQQDAMQDFINHHVMHHAGSADSWNFPFAHVAALELFHYDAVMLAVIVALLAGAAVAVRRSYALLPRGLASVAEAYVLFMRDEVVYPQFGEKAGRRFLSYFCTLFLFILTANVLGLFPLFSTATGNISVTAGLATFFMVAALGAVVRLRGLRGIKAVFVPHGLPGWLVPFMAVMEVVSFFSRVFALTVRLFCNMLAGHIVIYSLLGLIAVYGAVAAPSLLMAVLMYFFELFVAFLQAYVFTTLAAIFMGMMVNPQH